MAIKVRRNSAGNCVNFVGSTNPAYFNACLSGVVDTGNTVSVKNDIRSVIEGEDVYEFYQIPFTEFNDADGNSFATAQECADYITAQCNFSANTGSFILSETDTMDFHVEPTGTTILIDNGDAYAVNSILAVANDDGKINIVRHDGDTVIFQDLVVANATIMEVAVSSTLEDAVNELNALFQSSGSSSGNAPVITSPLTVNMTAGDILNYELTATDGVAFEWDNLPAGVVTVEGNARKLIGGSSLTAGTYNITAKAYNYFGSDTETVSLVVSSPTFANTKSLNFTSSQWVGGTGSTFDPVLGRASNGSGASDAWSISMWFKGGTSSNSGQTVLYYGAQDTSNGGHIALTYRGNNDNLRIRYGTTNNNLELTTPNNSLPSGTWKHVLVTYDGGTTGVASGSVSSYYSRFSVYIDGVLQSTSNTNDNYGYSGGISGGNFRIGRLNNSAYMRNNCRVEELALWGSDESSNVAAIYNSGSTHDLSLLGSAPTHWWRMGDGDTYPTLSDSSGAASLTMYNMTAADIVTDSP